MDKQEYYIEKFVRTRDEFDIYRVLLSHYSYIELIIFHIFLIKAHNCNRELIGFHVQNLTKLKHTMCG